MNAQFNFIDVKCRQLNVNGKGLFKSGFGVEVNRKVSKRIASDIIDQLNEYQRDKSSIPQELNGYEQEWRN